MFKRLLHCIPALFIVHHALAEDLFSPRDLSALDDALALMDMSQADFGFDKDVAEPKWYFQWSKSWLVDPRQSTQSAYQLIEEIGKESLPWVFIAETFEIPKPTPEHTVRTPDILVPSQFASLLHPFFESAWNAQELLTLAFETLPEEDRRRLACSFSAGMFAADDIPETKAVLLEAGFTLDELQRWTHAQDSIDPIPEGHWNLNAGDRIDLKALATGLMILDEAMETLKIASKDFTSWPDESLSIETPLGQLVIGSPAADVHSGPALLILDPSGNDFYKDAAGVANGLNGLFISTILDLEGDDRYRGEDLLAPGSAVFGISSLVDVSGDDVYEGAWIGNGSAAFGASTLRDLSGNDTYRAQGFGQAAGHVGLSLVEDSSGNDLYDIGFAGQGFAGFKGLGLLIDRHGNDTYKAGGVRPDYERHDDRYLSMAQGFAIGVRPWAGGGRGVLVDLQGDDRYIADVYGQGVGYWYSAGMLLDVEGNDQYSMFQYGQGAGIHLSLGLLADLEGRDQYTGYVLTQGAAHDYAVGILIEGDGDDTYVADHFSQGRAMNNSLAILLDRKGQDGYFSRQCDRSQGIGNNADLRDYGSLALILDLAGKDQYSCGAVDNDSQFRPDFGQIYDREVTDEK